MQPQGGEEEDTGARGEMRDHSGDEARVSLSEKVLFWQNNW